jgi:hypothetical protein
MSDAAGQPRDRERELYSSDLPTVRGWLASDDPDDRARAAWHWPSLASEADDYVEALLRLSDDVDELVRYHAVVALGGLGPRAAPATARLRAVVEDGPHYLRLTAHRTLRAIAPDDAGPVPPRTGSGPYPCPYFWLLRKYFRYVRPFAGWCPPAFPTLRPLVTRLLYRTHRRVTFATGEGRLLSLTLNHWSPDFGGRPIDAPLLRRLTRPNGPIKVTAYEQPDYEKPDYSSLVKFVREISADWWLESHDPENFGVDPAGGRIYLMDYYAGSPWSMYR